MTGSALARTVALLTPLACAGPTGGGLAELGDAFLLGVGAPTETGCPAASVAGADAGALGLGGLRFEARGQELASLAVQLGEVTPVVLTPAGDADDGAEVAGRSPCPDVAWGRVVVIGTPARVRLVAPAGATRTALDEGLSALARGRGPEARVAFARAGVAADPPLPGPGLAVAHSYAREERFGEAVAAYADVAARFAAIPLGELGLADALRRSGKRVEAADAFSRAIALWPAHKGLVQRAAADPFVEVHPAVPPPAQRRADGRWVLFPRTRDPVAPETGAALAAEATAYASCKEAFRTRADLRVRFGGAEDAWRWSPAEESVCTAVWLTTYVRHRETGRLEDAGLDDLLLVARQGFLDERSFFDVGARVHPLAPALLDAPSRARLLTFVSQHRVLRRRQGGWLF